MKLNSEVNLIISTLTESGFEAYAVGGCVRDYLLGKAPKDWDVCTSARPEQIIKCFERIQQDSTEPKHQLFQDKVVQIAETGIRYGTVTVIIDHFPVEVTTYRTESDYDDNRRPSQVEFVDNLKEDLARRDFTMNALAYSPAISSSSSIGDDIIDYFGGVSDINNQIIRAVGNPRERMDEDALRILRALRFASELGFTIEEELSNTIHDKMHLLDNISAERIRNEFDRILMGDYALNVLRDYRNIFARFIPEIEPMFNFTQDNPYHYLDCWEHTLEAVSVSAQELPVRLAMFFHDIGKPSTCTRGEDGTHFYGHEEKSEQMTRSIMNRLKYSNEMKATVLTLIKYHDIQLTKKNILRWMNRIGEDRVELLIEVMAADIKAQSPKYYAERRAELNQITKKFNEILENNKCFKLADLALSGKDLIDMGYPQDKSLGQTLNRLLDAVLDGEVENSREALIDFIS